jgi:ammonia channel protein AmtB
MKKLGLSILIVVICISRSWAGDEPPTIESNKNLIDLVQTHADYVWTLVAAALVFFMQAGFALVETGFTRAKNAVNIMMKNLMDFSMGSLAFWAIGFGIMFGASSTGWFGTSGFFLSDFEVGGDPWVLAFWMFQVVFCATAATIVSGAMAERTKFSGYLIYSAVLSAIIYPVFGNWAWGTLAAGIFNIGGTSAKIIGVQLLGISACFLWVFPAAFLMFKLIDKTIGLRVSPEEEMEGLDLAEHGGNAYPDFEVSSYGGVGTAMGPGSPSASGDASGQFKPVEQT